MKYLFFLMLSLVIAVGCTSQKAGAGVDTEAEIVAAASTAALYEGALFEGAAMGYRGMIHVRVGLDRGTITEITVLESREDWNVGGAAIEELTDLVLMYNTTELDAVSGATETSRGFLESIENAIMGP